MGSGGSEAQCRQWEARVQLRSFILKGSKQGVLDTNAKIHGR
jgi:hypothetical protein